MRHTVTLVLAVILGTLPLCTGCKKTKEGKAATAERKLLRALEDTAGIQTSNTIAQNIKSGETTALHIAVQCGKTDIAKELIEAGVDIDAKDIHGNTPLHIAVTSKLASQCLKMLLDAGANPDITNKADFTPLHVTVSNSYEVPVIEVMKTLIAAKADVDCRNGADLTPLHYVVRQGDESMGIEAAKLLITAGADINAVTNDNSTAMHYAVFYERRQILKTLIESRANVNAKDDSGFTPLHYSARKAFSAAGTKMTRLLIAAGADINAKSNQKSTPMHDAAAFGANEILKILIDSNAEIDARDNEGHTPLIVAIWNGSLICIETLLNANADYMARTNDEWSVLTLLANKYCMSIYDSLIAKGAKEPSWTTLHYEAIRGDEASVKKAIASGDHLNKQDAVKRTPLMWAVLCNKNEVIQSLLTAGARTDIKDIEAATLLHAAARSMNADFIPDFIAAGLNVNELDENGWTPLHYAAINGGAKATKLLLEAKAHPDIPAKDGTRPLLLVLKNIPRVVYEGTRDRTDDYKEVAAILIEAGADLCAVNSSGKKAISYIPYAGKSSKDRLAKYYQHSDYFKLKSILSHYANLKVADSVESISTDTPQGVLQKMTRSLYLGRPDVFASCVAGSEKEIAAMRKYAEFFTKVLSFRKAMMAEYGEKGWLEYLDQKEFRIELPILDEREIPFLTIKVTKDEATVEEWEFWGEEGLVICKKPEGWRVRFSSLVDSWETHESIAKSTSIIDRVFSEGLAIIGKPGMTPKKIHARLAKAAKKGIFR